MAAANKQEEQPSSSNAASSWKVNEWLHNNTYANVTKTAQPISKQNPTDKNQRKLNTFTFFNLMTSEDITERILKDLESHFTKKASTLVAKILRDTRFRSRYQVTFYNEDDVERLINNGITINGIRVRGNIERYANPVKPIRFYIPNLPSFLNEDEVQELIGDDNTSYVKQKQNRKFGVPVGGFYVGIYNSSREDRFIKFEGEDYKMVCLDKTRNVASHNATPSEVPPEVPNIIAPPKEPNTKSPAAPIGKITPKEPNKTAPPEEPATKRKTPAAKDQKATPRRARQRGRHRYGFYNRSSSRVHVWGDPRWRPLGTYRKGKTDSEKTRKQGKVNHQRTGDKNRAYQQKLLLDTARQRFNWIG